MTDSPTNEKKPKKGSRAVRWLFLTWAILSTGWMANSFRTQGVDRAAVEGDAEVTVVETGESLQFLPAHPKRSALLFLCGSGVAADAYAPLLRPIAAEGYRVTIIKLPMRFAPLESHKAGAIERARREIAGGGADDRWVVAGHSLGAALACRIVQGEHSRIRAMVLLGTTHPKEDDLSGLDIPVTKVYGDKDGVAPIGKVEANKRLLPVSAKFVLLRGANHSQFGHYGHQLMDGKAAISREEQQNLARAEILIRLRAID